VGVETCSMEFSGSVPKNGIAVSCEDFEKAKQVVDQYHDAMKELIKLPL